jgi:two-component system sensor histidine kinase BaeS
VKSLRARGFVSIAVAILVAVGVSLAIAALLVRHSSRQEALKALERQTALIAAQQRATPGGQQLTNLGAFFETQQERLAIISIQQATLLLPPSAAEALRAGRVVHGSVDVSGKHYLFAARPEGRQAIVLLRAAKLEASDWHPFALAFVIAAAVGAALAALAAFLLAGAVTRPIRRVAQASRRLAAGERPSPVPVEGSTELASLASAFNQMADDLERAKDAERSFLLSVSHELKTPLAAIRGHGEALLDGVIELPKGAGVVVQEAKRLERLVRDLLDLGRLNQRSFAVSLQPVDLAELVEEALHRHEAEAERLGISLVADASGPAPATADPDRVLQVLSNLIENALRSTPAGGEIALGAAAGSLTIADTGPGLAPDDLSRAFERFFLYRRYAQNRAVGTGLGLAIVKELTEAMGGSVTVESTPGRGTSFVVRLPEAEFLHSEHAAKASR